MIVIIDIGLEQAQSWLWRPDVGLLPEIGLKIGESVMEAGVLVLPREY